MQTATHLNTDDLTVIVVTFNSAHCIPYLAPTLATLPHTVIVDNASEDDTVELATQTMPNGKVIVNQRNLGFGAANNIALRQVKTNYALLLNPDCVPEAGFFEQILLAAEMFPDSAIIAPQLVDRGNIPDVNYYWRLTQLASKGVQAEGACCVGFVCGAAMLLNMRVMRDVGFFDETFFLYYEDADLCQRAFNLRKPIVVIPGITMMHLSRSSVRGVSPLKGEYLRGYHHAQSKLMYETKHLSTKGVFQLRWQTLLLALANLIPRLLFPQPRYLARLWGRIWGLVFFKS